MLIMRYLQQEALPLLLDLARTSSNEASVLFLLGRLYGLLGNRTAAMEMYTHARDLNPKLAGAIQTLVGAGREGTGNTM